MTFDRIYTFLIHKNLTTRLFLTLLVFIICFWLWFFIFYAKLSEVHNLLLADMQGLCQKKKLRSNLLEESDGISLKIKQLEKESINLISDNSDVGHIIKLAKSYDLKIVSCIEEEFDLIKFSMQGKFEQVFEFLQQIAILEIPVECKDFNMSLIKENIVQFDCRYKFYESLSSNES